MKIRARELVGIMTAVLIVTSPLTAYAGWEASGSSYQYRQEDGSYAVSQWIEEEGIFYYLDRNGQMPILQRRMAIWWRQTEAG